MEDNKEKVEFMLTHEQFEVISALFGHYSWNIDDALINKPSWERLEVASQLVEASTSPNQCNITSIGASNDESQDNQPSDQNIQDNDIEGECSNCFCYPCVTSSPQQWLGNGAEPHPRNSGLRKIRYKKFWTLLSRQNVWKNHRYQQKKARLFGRREEDHGIVWTNREIMPECVLTLVRGLYPNPTDVPYMGHKWV